MDRLREDNRCFDLRGLCTTAAGEVRYRVLADQLRQGVPVDDEMRTGSDYEMWFWILFICTSKSLLA